MSHNMEEIKVTWNRIKERLIAESHFMKFLDGTLDYFHWRYEEHYELPADVWTASGATRMVFGEYENCDVVFKILKDRTDINYNASEAFIYDRAQQNGLDEWFAWTALVEVIEINGVKTEVYAMDYCDVDADKLENASYDLAVQEYCDEEGKSLEEMSEEEKEDIYGWIEEAGSSDAIRHYMFGTYGYDAMSVLFNFLDDYEVNDTHAGNWGYLNGHLVLIDFGGYERDVIAMAKEAA